MIVTVTLHPALDKIVRLPRLIPNEAVRVRIEMVYGGGKGNNVARALTRLQIPVLATGFQGGATGEMLIQHFAEEGISTSFVECAAPTRTSVMMIEEETGHTYSLYEPGQTVTSQEIEQFRVHFLKLLEKDVSLVLFCGSAQTPELADLVQHLIQETQAKGIRCGLDSSGIALQKGIAAQPYLVKVNVAELSDFIGHSLATLEEQSRALLEINRSGVPLVALTRGSQGMLITDGKVILTGELSMPRVLNVMGCGDSALAGIASTLYRAGSLVEMLRRGVACGAANTQVLGAGFIDPNLVSQLESQVVLREVVM